MKYNLETPTMLTKFSELKYGDVFYPKWGDDPEYRHFFIKIFDPSHDYVNSLDINTNYVKYSFPDEPVYKVHNAEFKITV